MPKRRTSRRQFLTGRSAIEALGDLTHGELETPAGRTASGETRREACQLHFSRRAMACEFAVFLPGNETGGSDAALAALDRVDALENQLSVYIETSDVSRLNASAADQPTKVEAGLFKLLAQSLEIYRETDRAFDITSGPLTKVWGFFRRQGRIPQPADLQEALQLVGSEQIGLDSAEKTVRFAQPGVEINLGGIGKGYALDEAAWLLSTEGVENLLIHGGASSVLAQGSSDASKENSGWIVGLRHPLRPERRLAEIRLKNQALGTSGSASQYFHHQGKRYGHVLDPRTGMPAEGLLSATVLAPTAALADAFSTALHVMGMEAALEFLNRRKELAAVLIAAGNRSGEVEVVRVGIPEECWKEA